MVVYLLLEENNIKIIFGWFVNLVSGICLYWFFIRSVGVLYCDGYKDE